MALFVAHGPGCLIDPWLIALHSGSHLVIGCSYTVITYVLVISIIRTYDNPEPFYVTPHAVVGFCWVFATFIATCALTHFGGILEIFTAVVYWITGAIKVVCASVSAASATKIWNHREDLWR